MPTYLSEAEVFGNNQQYLSEEEVFGKPANQKRSIADAVSAGIGAVIDDVTGGIARHDARRRAELMARGNEATQSMLADSQASGTAAELQARADSIEAAKPSAVSSIVARGIDFARDAAVSGAQGVIGLGESVVGIGDLATGWTGATPGGALKHVGYDPEAAKKALGDLKSDAGKDRDAIYESTRGFTGTLMTLGTNPGMLADKIFESLAGTVGAGAVGAKAVAAYMPRAVEAATAAGLTGEAAQAFIADKIAKVAIGSAAAAEGAQQAGSLAESARQAGVPWKQYVGPALASGAGTAAIAAASGGVAKRVGIGDIEADIAMRGARGGVKTDPGFVVNRAAIEGFKEGAIEEMPQSTQEAAWENVAKGRPWDEGLGKAAATGLATGAGMGGGHAALSRPGKDQPAAPGSAPVLKGEIRADEVLGAETEADKTLYTPKQITALDRVAELDAKLNELHPQAAAGDQEAANEWNRVQAERRTLTSGWPAATPGAQITFSTETGSRLDGQYALMEAGDLTTSHDENLRPVATYPAELQPRERERHASEMQVQQIVQKLDPARLGESADVATGAPIVGADGLVESGNARTIALKRVYQANGQKADDYRQFIKANADRFGIAPDAVDAMQRPILVRVRTTPVNRAEFARQANAATVARMSPSEQARADAAAIDSLEDLNPDEAGDFMSVSSTPFVRRFLAKLPTTEQAALIDSIGRLSQAGYARIRNAVLAKAYGDSPVLLRMVESMDDSTRNVTKALMRVAPQVAKTREAIGDGALHDVDLTPDLMAAVEELASLKEKGVTVEQALAQAGMFGDKLSPEARDLLAFLNDNIRSPRRIADFIQRYLEALSAVGNPNQGSLLGDVAAPAKGDLMAAAKRGDDGVEEDAGGRQPAESGKPGEEGRRQSADAQGGGGRAGGDEAAGGQAGVEPRAEAARDFQDALADLGAIVRDYANVARMVPEDTPGLMDTLVRLFDAAMRLGYHDAKKAIAYVKGQLRGDARFKSVWNKIQQTTYQNAAKQAADDFAQGADGLFGAPQDEAPAAREAITIDGLEYDLDAPHFGMAPPPRTLKDGDPLLVETNTKPADSMVKFDGRTMTRSEMRQILEDGYFRNAVPAPDGRNPIAYVMGGGGASGKGTIKKYLRKEGVILARDPADDAVGMSMRATNSLTHLARQPAALRQRIDESKAKRSALEGRLDAKFQFAGELADKLKEADALEAAMLADQQAAEDQPAEPGAEPKLTRMERALFAGRMRVEDVRAVVEGFRKVAKNLPAVHVLQDTKDAPRAVQKWLRENDAMHDAAGLFHDGEIYIFSSHLADIAHAQRVFLHEAQHYGLSGIFGTALDEAMLYLYEHNGTIKVKADARKEVDRSMSVVRAVEEVLADMAGDAKKLTGWKRLVAAVRDFLRKAGWVENVTDNDVAYLIHRAELYWKRAQKTGYANVKRGRLMRLADDLAEQEKWLSKEAKARGYGSIDELAEKDYPLFEKLASLWRQKHPVKDAMLSRAGTAAPALTIEQQAEAVIQQKAATARPIETVLRAATKATKFDKLTTAAWEKAGALLDSYTPETIKAGVVSDYGVPEAVIDRRAVTEGRQRKQLRAAGALLEKLATLTRAESRLAYAWMNNDDPQAAAYFEDQLPPESVATMREVRDLIDKLSQEAVRLGQLDPEAFKRNRFAYLHRSYAKHTAELSHGEAKSRARAISILGDQYKGRGMTDAADMARIKNTAPEWWNRKLRAGQADKQLKGEQFIRLERRAPTGDGTEPLPGIDKLAKKPRLLEVAYWPAAEPLPSRYSTWDRAGTWEVRGTKGANVVLWRDFTALERQALGEIDEVRFAIAKTLHAMIHDVETGKYLEWLGQTYAKKEGEEIDGTVVEASERMRDTFKPGEWVKVPESEIPGTKVKKYGVLAGRYLPGPIWNDVRQMGGNFKPLGETYSAILKAWKSSKTALSPAVHMNNVMANFVMADWHDVTAGHVAKALRLMLSKDEVAAEVLARYGESGGTIGTWATKELQQEQLKPMLDALEKELGIAGSVTGQVGVMAALQLALRGQFPAAWDAFKPSKTGQVPVKAARALISLYEAEDQVFRLAAWLKAKEEGATDLSAGKAARKSFLDYSINAPWVQMMRSTAFPFIAFTYRSVPMLLETAAKKPWKLLKLGLVAGAANALGYLLSGGDEDDERKLLPEEKAGRIWGITPKLVRMPWNDANGSPVFLDVRRWVPVGDIFDTGSTHSAIPVFPAMVPGGPLALLAEIGLNQVQFSGKAITLETDTPAEKAQKLADHLYKAFAPNIILLPGTYAWTGAVNAGTGRTDSFGREQSLAQAVISSVGIKVGSYPKDVLQLNAQREAQGKMMEIDRNLTGLKREYQRKGITAEELQEKAAAQVAKKRKVMEDLQKRLAGG